MIQTQEPFVNSPVMMLDLMHDRPRQVQEALDALAISGTEARGAIYTRPQVVEFILDLSGYTTDLNLCEFRLLEPSFGSGEFLFAAVRRLLESFERQGLPQQNGLDLLRDSIRGVELHIESHDRVRSGLLNLLSEHGFSTAIAGMLVDAWLIRDDFLLTELPCSFTHVVGNLPYLRQEEIHPALIHECRQRYPTIFDRADIYIPFIERGLRLLSAGGTLAYICANRWAKNKYGGPLRQLIADEFHLRCYVDLEGATPFLGDVTAYPGIFLISRERSGQTSVVRTMDLHPEHLRDLAAGLNADSNGVTDGIERHLTLVSGSDPWMLDSAPVISVLRQIEGRFPLLEQNGCTVGIGVATGADKIYLRACEDLPVEDSRKLPIVGTADIRSGRIEWKGRCVLNPFEPSGELVDLHRYPMFATYVHRHEETLRKRHVARRGEAAWYRTIDRINPDLVKRQKLLIPDIKGGANIVFDEGEFYPHHNLYYVVSDNWDLRALQAILRSTVAEFFVAMYSVRMRGGYLRFQAQYIRRIRIPRWESLSSKQQADLVLASTSDRTQCDEIAFELYGVTDSERDIISGFVHEAEQGQI